MRPHPICGLKQQHLLHQDCIKGASKSCYCLISVSAISLLPVNRHALHKCLLLVLSNLGPFWVARAGLPEPSPRATTCIQPPTSHLECWPGHTSPYINVQPMCFCKLLTKTLPCLHPSLCVCAISISAESLHWAQHSNTPCYALNHQPTLGKHYCLVGIQLRKQNPATHYLLGLVNKGIREVCAIDVRTTQVTPGSVHQALSHCFNIFACTGSCITPQVQDICRKMTRDLAAASPGQDCAL